MTNVKVSVIGKDHYEGKCLECPATASGFSGYSETEVLETLAEHFEEEHAGIHIAK